MKYKLSNSYKGKIFAKGLSFVLIGSYVLQPIAVFAQISTNDSTKALPPSVPTSSKDISQQTPLVQNDSNVISDTSSESNNSGNQDSRSQIDSVPATSSITPQPQSSGGTTQDIPISVKEGTGLSGGNNPSSGTQSGAFTYDYPFSVPTGRNGMTPTVQISYSSTNHEDQGFGYGWSASIPYIERYNKNGFDALYSTSSPSTSFYSSLSGELATSTSGYLARNDDGSNLQYSFVNSIWTVIDKSGTTYIFGLASTSRQDDVNGSGRIFKWMLQSQTDSNGNSISYTYTKDSGQIYPLAIAYSNTSTSTGIFSVQFSLGLQATSTATSTQVGFPVKTRYDVNQILVQTLGTTTRSYSLSYGTGDNGSRTILKGVTESGQNAGGTITLPSTLFGYSTSTAAMATSTWSNPAGYFSFGGSDRGISFTDINGDGLSDIVQSFEVTGSYTSRGTYLNTGAAWSSATSTFTPPCDLEWSPQFRSQGPVQDGGGRVVDINGDGLPDFICNTSAYLNNGTNWVASSTWDLPINVSTTDASGYKVDSGARFADINGDGLVDILIGYSVNVNFNEVFSNSVYLNNGHGWTLDPTWVMPNHLDFTTDYGQDGGGRVADLNGDGLADLLLGTDDNYNSSSTVYINNGHGWTSDSSWLLPSGSSATSPAFSFVDINNDGLQDIAISYGTLINDNDASSFRWDGNYTYLNTGSGWKLDTTRFIPLPFSVGNVDTGFDTGPRFGNISGKGMNDLIVQSLNGFVGFTGIQLAQGDAPDLLNSVNESQGKKITVTYNATTNFKDTYGSTTNPNLPFYFPAVQKIQYNDGVKATTSINYSYNDGRYYFGSPTDRRSAGFGQIITTDPLGNVTKAFYHTGSGTATSSGEYADVQSKIGKVYRTENYNSVASLYKVVVTKWDSFIKGASNMVWPVRSTELDYDGKVSHRDSAHEYSYSTTTGDILQQTDWGEVTALSDGSFSDTGTDKYITSYTYAASSTSPLTAASSKVTTDQSGNFVSKAQNFFDGLSLGSITKGNITEQDSLKTGTTTYVKSDRKSYNLYGLVTQDIDPRFATTTYSYDVYNLYPATTTDALSHITTAVYNYFNGKPTQIKDANGTITQWSFDPLARILSVRSPDPAATTTLATTTTYSYTDSLFPRIIQETDYLNSASSTNKYTFLDGYGRTIENRKQAEASNTYAVTDIYYNGLELVASTSLPYFGIGISYTGISSPPTSSLLSTNLYDALGRVTSVVNSVGSTLNSYGNWEVSTTDPNGNYKDFYKDAYGNLTSVVEHLGTTTATTSYTYDGNKSLTKITDALGNVRNFTYDLLGRRLTAQDLHAATDASYGIWQYVYDDANNISQQTDPKSQIVNYGYDLLNRKLTEDYTGVSGTELTNTYDSCSYGLGRLCSATATSSVIAYAYDPLGNTVQETDTVSGTPYVTKKSYDRLANVTCITYPDNSQVSYTYNAGNLLESIGQKESGASGFSGVVSNFDYAPTGKIANEQYANGVTTTYTYDASHLYRLSRIHTISSGGFGTLVRTGGGSTSSLETETHTTDTDKNPAGLLLMGGMMDSIALDADSSAFDSIDTSTIQTTTPATIPDDTSTSDSSATTDSSTDSSISSNTDENTASSSSSTGNSTLDDVLPAATNLLNASSTGELNITPAISSSTATNSDYLNSLSTGDNRLKLKAAKEEILGSKQIDGGLIKYAYRTNESVDSMPIAEGTISQAEKIGVELGKEVISKRTSHSRTYETNIPNEYISEISTGDPIYYKDDSGTWWIAGYGITTSSAFSSQTQPAQLSIVDKILNFILPQKAFAVSSTFYPGSGAGATTVDGETYDDSSANWTTERNDYSSVYSDYTNTNEPLRAQYGNGNGPTFYGIIRGLMGFDTSSLSSLANVTSATLSLYITNSSQAGSENRIYLASSTPVSNSSISAVDYSRVGSTSLGSTNGSAYTNNAYASITLNATGTSTISTTGITNFGLRSYNDLYNVAPTASTAYEVDWDTAESGASTSPKLIVTYTMAPNTPNSLYTDSLANPTNIGDHTPKFSALFNDIDPGDYATNYQLQVATSSIGWTSMFWDSGKTAATASTTNGTRIPDITYGGSTLQTSTPYYWRVRFWDSYNNTGAWSTETASFTLASWYNPAAPTSLQTNGSINPTGLSSTTPSFTAIYNNTIATDTLSSYQIQVATSPSSWTSTYWDSLKSPISSSTPSGMRTPSMGYGGQVLVPGNTYYWRIRFWNSEDSVGDWSTTTASFNISSTFAVGDLQDIYYTYDNNGNIIQTSDLSGTGLASVNRYTYDSLNRLISTSATATTSNPGGAAWYNPSWLYRVPITASSTLIKEDTKDVYLNLSSLPSGMFTHAQSNGCDLRVTASDGVTELPLDLVSYASSTGQLHFSTGNSLTTNPNYYLYYGNPSATCYASSATYGAQNVYDSATRGVWHLEQSTATVGGIKDSTANHHDGTMYANYTPASNGVSAGKLGNAADFNGTNTTLDVPNSTDFLSNAFTIEGWMYMNQSPGTKGEDEIAVVKKHGSSPYQSYALKVSSPNNSTDGSWENSVGSTSYAGTYSGATPSGAWEYLVLRHDPSQVGSELSVRTNGSSSGTYTASSTGSVFNSTDVLRFGADYAGGSRLDGAMDEVRYHNNALSDNYLQTRYANMNSPSSFWSAGSEAQNTGSSTASSTSYTETYSYDLLGNLLAKTGAGNYTYAGNIGTNYANPHAATAIGTSMLAYDNDGNLTSMASTTYAWDYLNELASLHTTTGTSTYAYDANHNRVKKTSSGISTIYPNTLYNIMGTSTITRNIFDTMGNLVQTTNGGAATTTAYIHPDILGSTNVTTGSTGHMAEALNYRPYGAINADLGILNTEPRKFIGQLSDAESNLSYLNARYYDGSRGQFLSQDPMFWSLSTIQLLDPQQQNSYSYARNNPISGSDPSGLLTVIVPGTNYSKKDWSATGSAKNFINSVGKTFGETPQILNWSGGDNKKARDAAAASLVKLVDSHQFADGEKLNIVGHSHGGNIGIEASNMLDRKIDNLVTLGTPVRSDYQPNYSMIGNFVNAYSNADIVQHGGGNSGYSLLGGALFGIPGSIAGSLISGAEFGPAGGRFSGADNINVTSNTFSIIPIITHSGYWTNPDVWSKVSSQL